MKSLLQSCAFALAILTTLGSQSFAGIIQGDFSESLDLPSVTGGPRVLLRELAAVGNGFELTELDEVNNPSGLQGYLLVDLADNFLTLTSVGPAFDFQLVSVDISSILFDTDGQFISGVKLVSSSLIDTSVNPTSSATEMIAFTNSSINISWSVADPFNTPDTFSFLPDSATYEITFGAANPVSAVPEPGTLSILGLGAIAVLLRARRRNRD